MRTVEFNANEARAALAAAKEALRDLLPMYQDIQEYMVEATRVTGANVENASYGLSLRAKTVAEAATMNAGRRGGLLALALSPSGERVGRGACRHAAVPPLNFG